jgi:hypothetical protein
MKSMEKPAEYVSENQIDRCMCGMEIDIRSGSEKVEKTDDT